MITVRTIQRNRMSTTANSMVVTSMRRTSGTVSSLKRAFVRRSRRLRSLLSIAGAAIPDLPLDQRLSDQSGKQDLSREGLSSQLKQGGSAFPPVLTANFRPPRTVEVRLDHAHGL